MATDRLNSTISQAQQGNPRAISELLNAALMPIGITARVTGLKDCVTIFANGKALPNKASLVGIVERGFADLEIDAIARVKVYGKSASHPEEGWSDEIVFFDGVTNAARASKRFSGRVLKQKLAGLLSGGSAHARKLLVNKRVVYGVLGLAVTGVAASGGMTGYKLLQARSAYAATISEAQALVSETTPSEEDGVEQLDAKLAQLKQARQLLRGVPESQSSAHKEAQQALTLVSQRIEHIETTLAEMNSVADRLGDITGEVSRVLAAVAQPPYAIEDWNKAKQGLVGGITKLGTIPQYGPLADKIQGHIEEYQGKVAWVDQAIANEQKGVDEVAKANEIALAAYNLTNGRNKFTATDLEAARDKWQAAIDQVKTVPATTNAYRSVSDRIDIYTKNKNKVIDGIYELNSCIARYPDSSSMQDYCRGVYLSLTKPR